MKNIFNQIETMGLTTIKEFTGINAANEPHSAFMQMLCDYRFADKEEVMLLTGLSSNGYERVFQEKPKIGMFSYRLSESNVISHLFNSILKKKETNPNFGGVIYENDISGNQAGIIQLGMALNFDYIILNGVNMSDQKITKIKAYIEELDNLSNIKNLPEDEIKDPKKENMPNKVAEEGNAENKINNENINPN